MEDIRTFYEPRMKACEFEFEVFFFPLIFSTSKHLRSLNIFACVRKTTRVEDEKEGKTARVRM